jgi:inner membrane translocase subunit Tim23
MERDLNDQDKLTKDLTYAPTPATSLGGRGLGFGAGVPGMLRSSRDTPLKAEFLFPEHAKKQRSFTEKLCYGTGVSYLAGQAVGGTWGFVEFLRGPSYTSPRLRLNGFLNALTRRGPFVANSVGVLALGYNFCNEAARQARGGTEDSANHVVAGIVTGALFKSTAGMRKMALAAGLGGTLAAIGSLAVYTLAGKDTDSSPANMSMFNKY